MIDQNNVQQSVNSLISGLSGLAKLAESMVDGAKKDLSPDQAKAVANQMKAHGVNEKISEMKEKLSSLNSAFDNLK